MADTALDSKLLGLLGFFAVAASILLTVPHGLDDLRALLLAGVGLGALACLWGSMGGSIPSAGPSPTRFYARYGTDTEIDYLTQLLADLADAVEQNRNGLERRDRALAFAIRGPILLAIVYGLLSLT